MEHKQELASVPLNLVVLVFFFVFCLVVCFSVPFRFYFCWFGNALNGRVVLASRSPLEMLGSLIKEEMVGLLFIYFGFTFFFSLSNRRHFGEGARGSPTMFIPS